MPVTQSWNFMLVPKEWELVIEHEFVATLETAKQYLSQHENAFELWKKDPVQFGWHTLACDINDRHMYYNLWVDKSMYFAYINLYSRPEFEELFYKYFLLGGPREEESGLRLAEIIVADGNTPADLFYQALGPDYISRLQGFFGNLYIKSDEIKKAIDEFDQIKKGMNWEESMRRAAEWYGGPCNKNIGENIDEVENIFRSYQNALNIALLERCSLLGINVVVG